MNGQKKNIIKINEAQLKQIISESVKMVLNETLNNYPRTNNFDATKSDYWKTHHNYDDDRADRASSWMGKHYDLEEENEDDVDHNIDYDNEEDDWRSEEPSENDVTSILRQIQEKCNECGAMFKDLGENEFGVISRNGNCPEVENLLQMLESKGIIYNTGGQVSKVGPWHAKFRVIRALNK